MQQIECFEDNFDTEHSPIRFNNDINIKRLTSSYPSSQSHKKLHNINRQPDRQNMLLSQIIKDLKSDSTKIKPVPPKELFQKSELDDGNYSYCQTNSLSDKTKQLGQKRIWKVEHENIQNNQNHQGQIRKTAPMGIAKDKTKQTIAKQYLWMRRSYNDLLKRKIQMTPQTPIDQPNQINSDKNEILLRTFEKHKSSQKVIITDEDQTMGLTSPSASMVNQESHHSSPHSFSSLSGQQRMNTLQVEDYISHSYTIQQNSSGSNRCHNEFTDNSFQELSISDLEFSNSPSDNSTDE